MTMLSVMLSKLVTKPSQVSIEFLFYSFYNCANNNIANTCLRSLKGACFHERKQIAYLHFNTYPGADQKVDQSASTIDFITFRTSSILSSGTVFTKSISVFIFSESPSSSLTVGFFSFSSSPKR